MNKFLLALQFLTIIPVRLKNIQPKEIGRSLIFFPLVGLFIGLLLAGINHLLSGFPALTSAVILVVSSVILTGGLHLDGLADTFDAAASGKNKEEMLNIMKDPHIGTMGVSSIVCALLLKVTLLAGIPAEIRSLSLILMGVASRWAMVLAISAFTYARAEGKAKAFFEEKNMNSFLLATVMALSICILASGVTGLGALAIASTMTYLAGSWINKKITGITGDNLGAINEVTEITVIIYLSVIYNIL